MPILEGPRGRVRLAYCTNVHPGETLAEVEAALDRHAVRVRERLGLERMGVGLWLAAGAARELARDGALAGRFRAGLAARGLAAFTANAFPFGGFHAPRVKTAVYRPSWAEDARAAFTLDVARALAALLPEEEEEGTISTLPIAWRGDGVAADAAEERLARVAAGLREIRRETGKRIRLLLEPEPGCVLERTDEAIELCARFDREHLGVCFDCCHQAVMGEDLAASLAKLGAARVPVGKIHLSSAVEGAVADLASLVEPRWLHQVMAEDGRRAYDLEAIARDPAWRAARARVHFHVPIYAERLAGGLATTRPALEAALDAAFALPEMPDLEIETYTWEALPAEERPRDLAEGIAREMAWVLERLRARSISVP